MRSLPAELHTPSSRRSAEAAVGRRTVKALLDAGRLIEMWPGVLVSRDRALDPATRHAAALLFGGPDATLAGVSAAAVHGCSAAATPTVHLLLPYTRWLRTREALVIHHGRRAREDITTVDGLAVLTLEAAVTDLLCTERPRLALAVADQAAGLFAPAQRAEFCARIADRVEHRADRRGTLRATNLLDLVTGKAESPPESWLRLLVAEVGYPPPAAQVEIHDSRGRLRYVLDLAWPELRIALEYDGYEWHEQRTLQDARRDEDLRRRGWWVIRVVADDFRDSVRFLGELAMAFRARGAALPGDITRTRPAEHGPPTHRAQ